MSTANGIEIGRGVYDTPRAAALAGVPQRTLHHWAHTHLYEPSIAPGPRTRLWSWGDLLALRVIHWLRIKKDDQADIPRVSLAKIRELLSQLDEVGVSRERLHDVTMVTRAGVLLIELKGNIVRARPGRQAVIADVLQPVRPYNLAPDLLTPRPMLRIVPGKLHGEPHIVDTRIPSVAIFELEQSGYSMKHIQRLYSDVPPEALAEALDLEQALHAVAA